MKKGAIYLSILLLVLSNLIFVYGFEVSSEYCGDGIYPSTINKQCDSGINLVEGDIFSFYTADHCNPPGSENECQCALDSASDGNGHCLFCGDGVLTKESPLNEECEGSINCNSPGSFNQCKCVSGYINDTNGNCHQCWGNNLNEQTCKTQGFETGILSCDINGNFNTTACFDCPSGQIVDNTGKCICPPGTIPNPAYSGSPLLVSNTINQVVTTFTNSLSGITTPACIDAPVPCSQTQNKTCWDKCQICTNGKTGDCGPNPNTLIACDKWTCCVNNTGSNLNNEICKGVDLGIVKGFYCKETCKGKETLCGDAFCCDQTSTSTTQCKIMPVFLKGIRIPIPFTTYDNAVGLIGYCQPKVCGSSKTAYDDKCNKVADGQGKHYLCCKSNEHCGLRWNSAVSASIPACVADTCPDLTKPELCAGWPNGWPNTASPPAGLTTNLPSSPPTVSSTTQAPPDNSGKLAICCPKGTCIISEQGLPRCNPPTGSYGNP